MVQTTGIVSNEVMNVIQCLFFVEEVGRNACKQEPCGHGVPQLYKELTLWILWINKKYDQQHNFFGL